ncbi:hypothetical protein Tco_0073564 [Tanacetum coccineum]
MCLFRLAFFSLIEVSKPSGSWVVFAVRVQYFPSNPSPPFTLNTISPLKGVRVFVNCQVGMGYKVGVSWEVYGEAIKSKRMEWVTKQKQLILPYGVLLTRLFKLIMNENRDLYNESYVLCNRVMNPFVAQQERKTRKDCDTRRGRHSTSSSSAFDQPASSYLNDDDDDDGNG